MNKLLSILGFRYSRNAYTYGRYFGFPRCCILWFYIRNHKYVTYRISDNWLQRKGFTGRVFCPCCLILGKTQYADQALRFRQGSGAIPQTGSPKIVFHVETPPRSNISGPYDP